MAGSRNVLLVANRTATTVRLHKEVERKAQEGSVRFHLLVPSRPPGVHRVTDPEVIGRREANVQLEAALPSLRRLRALRSRVRSAIRIRWRRSMTRWAVTLSTRS